MYIIIIIIIWGKTSSCPTSIFVAKVGRLDAQSGVQASNFCHEEVVGARRRLTPYGRLVLPYPNSL